MSIQFKGSSNQYARNAAPFVLGVPFTIGMLFRLDLLATSQCLWNLSDTGTTTNFWNVRIGTGNNFIMSVSASSDTTVTSTMTIGSGQWGGFIYRAIANNNRKMACINLTTGVTEHLSSTTNVTPSGIDTMTIGARLVTAVQVPLTGCAAEFWYTNTDIQPGGAALEGQLFRQLMFQGPFAVPGIARQIIEYKNFMQAGVDLNDDGDESFNGGPSGFAKWTAVGSPIFGAPHPQGTWGGAFATPYDHPGSLVM